MTPSQVSAPASLPCAHAPDTVPLPTQLPHLTRLPWSSACQKCQLWSIHKVLFFTFPRYLQTVHSQRGPSCPSFKIAQYFLQGIPGGATGKEPTCQCRRQRRRFDPWVGKIPWKRAWQPTPVFLPGESHGQRSLAGYSPWVAKSQIWLKGLSTYSRHFLPLWTLFSYTNHWYFIPLLFF